MLFFIVTGIILVIFIVYPKSKWEASVVLFVTFIVQNAILSETNQFLGFIDQVSVVSFIVIFSAYKYNAIVIRREYFDKTKKIILFLAFFYFIFYLRYTAIKDGIIYSNFELVVFIKRLIRDSVYVFSLYLIIQRMYDINTLRGLENGLLLAMIIILPSIVFYDFFLRLGFSMHKDLEYSEGLIEHRMTGFLGINSNYAGFIFNIIVSYVYAKTNRKKIFPVKLLILLGLAILGILFIASKTASFVFLFITLLYFYINAKSITSLFKKGFVVLLIGSALVYYFGDLIMERMELQLSGEYDTLGSRQRYWIIYLNDFVEHSEYFLLGNIGERPYFRDVHNTYISFLYYGGFLTLIIVLYCLWKVFLFRNKYRNNFYYYTPLFLLVVILIQWITGAGKINYWFILVVAASPGIPKYFYDAQINKAKVTTWRARD